MYIMHTISNRMDEVQTEAWRGCVFGVSTGCREVLLKALYHRPGPTGRGKPQRLSVYAIELNCKL